MSQEIFRKVALERLSSPEQLDALTQVTSARSELALAALWILLAMAVVWGIWGDIPTKVTGNCILIREGGLFDVAATAGGRVTDISVAVGDTVARGETVARVAQPDLLERVRTAEIRLRELADQERRTRGFAERGETLSGEALAQQLENLKRRLEAAEQKIRLLRDREATQKTLLADGLVTKQTLIATQVEISATVLEAEGIKNQIKEQSLRRLEFRKQTDSELTAARDRLDENRYALESMLKEVTLSTQIVSPYSGRVVELKVDEGQLVGRGTSVLSIEPDDTQSTELLAYVYLPAAEGKKLRREMGVEITPSTVKREEHGFMRGVVRKVADYPSTSQGLMRLFNNEGLVRHLAGDAPPIEAVAELTPSAANASGYEWSTRNGPPFAIRSGTLCSASVVVAHRRPIELVLPFLKKSLGLD